MASGIAHRRTKPAIAKINIYPDTSNWGLDWRSAEGCRRSGKSYPMKRAYYQRRVGPVYNGELGATVPLELVHEIMLELDLKSLGNLRGVNSHFKEMVDSLPPYKLLLEHAPQTLGVMFRTGAAPFVPIKELYAEFSQPSCHTCDSFGQCIFLPTVRRCCESCLQSRAEFYMIPLNTASVYYGLTRANIQNKVPVVRCPPGAYGHPWRWTTEKRRTCFVSVEQVEAIGAEMFGSKDDFIYAIFEKREEANEIYQRRLSEWAASLDGESDQVGPKPRLPRTLSISSIEFTRLVDKWTCRGATDLPFWDPSKRTAESGVYCSACGIHRCFKRLGNQWREVGPGNLDAFTLETIPQHFKECPHVRTYAFGDRYALGNDKELGQDFLVNEKASQILDNPAIELSIATW
ncbi:hypothetical protein AJ80_03637 [Polytolypa hystricis UAMH7299]|uniref:F-box domain-containing protein n=1 Tax=Polytolypa hystricis (strain UAMH7299) TaxID=1447883 RepID=A0A2B7YH23_POLH7|nr:hypothetical protein AJ80_03637 [Polytolypa hystricis UAMH7299]